MLKLHYSSALSFNWQISGMERKNSQFSYWFWKKWKVSSPTKNNFFMQRNMGASDQAYDGGVIESKLPSPDVELMRYSVARPIPTYVVYYVLFSTRFYCSTPHNVLLCSNAIFSQPIPPSRASHKNFFITTVTGRSFVFCTSNQFIIIASFIITRFISVA